jgi:hypothetical protein
MIWPVVAPPLNGHLCQEDIRHSAWMVISITCLKPLLSLKLSSPITLPIAMLLLHYTVSRSWTKFFTVIARWDDYLYKANYNMKRYLSCIVSLPGKNPSTLAHGRTGALTKLICFRLLCNFVLNKIESILYQFPSVNKYSPIISFYSVIR